MISKSLLALGLAIISVAGELETEGAENSARALSGEPPKQSSRLSGLGVPAGTAAAKRADLEVTEFSFGPPEIGALLNPETVSFRLTNHGPDSLVAADSRVSAQVYLSRNNGLGDSDDTLLGEVGFEAALARDENRVIELSAVGRSSLTIPADATGDYFVFIKIVAIQVQDTNLSNNLVLASKPIHVTPLTSAIYAVFSGKQILSKNLALTPAACFLYNTSYGNNWRLVCIGGSFSGSFIVPEAGDYTLKVWHLSSASATCPGGGYSPVSIYVNGSALVEDFDPAEHHGAVHDFVADSWRFSALAGENLLDWVVGDLCTQYWIQRIEVIPVAEHPRFSAPELAQNGQITLRLIGQAGLKYVIEVSMDLVTWNVLGTASSQTGSVEFIDPEAVAFQRRFYRARQE